MYSKLLHNLGFNLVTIPFTQFFSFLSSFFFYSKVHSKFTFQKLYHDFCSPLRLDHKKAGNSWFIPGDDDLPLISLLQSFPNELKKSIQFGFIFLLFFSLLCGNIHLFISFYYTFHWFHFFVQSFVWYYWWPVSFFFEQNNENKIDLFLFYSHVYSSLWTYF